MLKKIIIFDEKIPAFKQQFGNINISEFVKQKKNFHNLINTRTFLLESLKPFCMHKFEYGICEFCRHEIETYDF